MGNDLAALILRGTFGLVCSQQGVLESLLMVETDIDESFITRQMLELARKEGGGLRNLRDLDLSHNNLSECYLHLMHIL
jgi:hypothetical protein